MTLDPEAVAASLLFPQDRVDALREGWGRLMDVCVFGDLQSRKIGALPRLRKKGLVLGEAIRALFADRAWIPHPREQLKNALASSLDARDALLKMEQAIQTVEGGGDLEVLEGHFAFLQKELMALLEARERRWASLLDSQYEER